MTEPEYLKPSEVARIFKVSHATVLRWRLDGRLPGIKIGGVVRFRSTDVTRLINEPEDVA